MKTYPYGKKMIKQRKDKSNTLSEKFKISSCLATTLRQ